MARKRFRVSSFVKRVREDPYLGRGSGSFTDTLSDKSLALSIKSTVKYLQFKFPDLASNSGLLPSMVVNELTTQENLIREHGEDKPIRGLSPLNKALDRISKIQPGRMVEIGPDEKD